MRRLVVLACVSAITLTIGVVPASATPEPPGPPRRAGTLSDQVNSVDAVSPEIAQKKAELEALGDEAASEIAMSASSDAIGSGEGVSDLADSTPVPVYRLSDKYNGAIFLTDDVYEAAAYLVDLGDYYQYDGVAFFYDTLWDTRDVYRFYNVETETYFYTADVAERDRVMAMYPTRFDYEGVCFKAGTGTLSVHRFYRREYGDHFYTASVDEFNALRADPSGEWTYEGVAFSVSRGLRIGTGTGSISGTVTGPDGQALSGLWVRASLSIGDYDQGTWTAVTNALGQYTIEDLPAGDYTITFGIWPKYRDGGYQYQPEYYNNARDFVDAAPVTVGSGEVTGINAKLEWFPQPVFRFYNFTNNTHFLTPSVEEALMVLETWPDVFRYEEVAYYTNPGNNSHPLYRFYNKNSASHFYTPDVSEAQYVMANYSHVYRFEGLTYSVNPGQVPNSVPVYRFYNLGNGSHFYTADPGERDYVRANYWRVYRYEDVKFWVGQ